jgi:hypothetical protein
MDRKRGESKTKANRTLLNACACLVLTTAAQAADIPKTWVETQAGLPTGQYLVIDLTLREIAWCLDWCAETYPGAVTDPKGPATGDRRVLRGGSSDDPTACCRSANRGAGGYPVYRNADFGFRVVVTMP